MTLVELLNKLTELGWKPWHLESKFRAMYFTGTGDGTMVNKNFIYQYGQDVTAKGISRSLNDLCSIDSGLWQFVCEKGLYDSTIRKYIEENTINVYDMPIMTKAYYVMSYNYRLMLSSIQEDKEKFLLDNILLPTNKDD